MQVSFDRSFSDGTVAPFLVLGLEGRQDITLQPGESSPEFAITMAMPCETGNEAMNTSGTVNWIWNAVPATPPTPPKPPKPPKPPHHKPPHCDKHSLHDPEGARQLTADC